MFRLAAYAGVEEDASAGALSDGAASEGASAGALSDEAASEGASAGALSDGAASEGAASDGAGADMDGVGTGAAEDGAGALLQPAKSMAEAMSDTQAIINFLNML